MQVLIFHPLASLHPHTPLSTWILFLQLFGCATLVSAVHAVRLLAPFAKDCTGETCYLIHCARWLLFLGLFAMLYETGSVVQSFINCSINFISKSSKFDLYGVSNSRRILFLHLSTRSISTIESFACLHVQYWYVIVSPVICRTSSPRVQSPYPCWLVEQFLHRHWELGRCQLSQPQL